MWRLLKITSFVALLLGTNAVAQTPISPGMSIPSPREEKFTTFDGVAIPWRDSDRICDVISAHPQKNCPVITVAERSITHMLSIYDREGALWYRLSVSFDDPAYYANDKTHDFRPVGQRPYYLLLRAVGESKDWYEVVVNEEKETIKFVRRDDPLWSLITWSDVFNWSRNVEIDQSDVELRDAPDGKIIADYVDVEYNRLKFMKLDGDWMYVEGIRTIPGTLYYGWIRWRDGRNILVGSILNGMRVPGSK